MGKFIYMQGPVYGATSEMLEKLKSFSTIWNDKLGLGW